MRAFFGFAIGVSASIVMFVACTTPGCFPLAALLVPMGVMLGIVIEREERR